MSGIDDQIRGIVRDELSGEFGEDYAMAGCEACRMVWDGPETRVRALMVRHSNVTRHTTRIYTVGPFDADTKQAVETKAEDTYRWFFGWESEPAQESSVK